jgi:hypothetical protein
MLVWSGPVDWPFGGGDEGRLGDPWLAAPGMGDLVPAVPPGGRDGAKSGLAASVSEVYSPGFPTVAALRQSRARHRRIPLSVAQR